MATNTMTISSSQQHHYSPLNTSLLHGSHSNPFKLRRSQVSNFNLNYMADSKFYKIAVILRPCRVEQVSLVVTISDVGGFGAQGGSTGEAGSELSEDNFVAKLNWRLIEEVIANIIDETRTGEIGDSKIFLTSVTCLCRVKCRTLTTTGLKGMNSSVRQQNLNLHNT
ncbi:hypothetical protein MKW92_033244 [Papaver armeniacum]|nr:hypothetical protein MKW92_033244 [Papaver armeniacum]